MGAKIVNKKIKALRRLNKNKMNATTAVILDFGSAKVSKPKKPLKQDVVNTKRKK
jgi:hypothetical protein